MTMNVCATAGRRRVEHVEKREKRNEGTKERKNGSNLRQFRTEGKGEEKKRNASSDVEEAANETRQKWAALSRGHGWTTSFSPCFI